MFHKSVNFSGIVRQSISNGIFPTLLKTSLVRPKLKKPDLKPDLLANYRPIANIPFLSKVLEKSAAIQVHNYLNDNDLFPALQSTYRKYHSTETALLRVTNDIRKTLDSNGEVILVLKKKCSKKKKSIFCSYLPLWSDAKICKLYNKSKISKDFCAILQRNQMPITHVSISILIL